MWRGVFLSWKHEPEDRSGTDASASANTRRGGQPRALRSSWLGKRRDKEPIFFSGRQRTNQVSLGSKFVQCFMSSIDCFTFEVLEVVASCRLCFLKSLRICCFTVQMPWYSTIPCNNLPQSCYVMPDLKRFCIVSIYVNIRRVRTIRNAHLRFYLAIQILQEWLVVCDVIRDPTLLQVGTASWFPLRFTKCIGPRYW